MRDLRTTRRPSPQFAGNHRIAEMPGIRLDICYSEGFSASICRASGDPLTQQVPLYQHTKRPEWGYCAIIEVLEDRTTYKFDDGSSRAISRNHVFMMEQVEPDEPEATEIRKRIAKHSPSRSLGADGKPKPKAKKKATAKKVAAPQP
jgi:hypothetical protein